MRMGLGLGCEGRTRRMGNGWDGWDGMGWAGTGMSWEWHRAGIMPSVMREPSAALLCQSACLVNSDNNYDCVAASCSCLHRS